MEIPAIGVTPQQRQDQAVAHYIKAAMKQKWEAVHGVHEETLMLNGEAVADFAHDLGDVLDEVVAKLNYYEDVVEVSA